MSSGKIKLHRYRFAAAKTLGIRHARSSSLLPLRRKVEFLNEVLLSSSSLLPPPWTSCNIGGLE